MALFHFNNKKKNKKSSVASSASEKPTDDDIDYNFDSQIDNAKKKLSAEKSAEAEGSQAIVTSSQASSALSAASKSNSYSYAHKISAAAAQNSEADTETVNGQTKTNLLDILVKSNVAVSRTKAAKALQPNDLSNVMTTTEQQRERKNDDKGLQKLYNMVGLEGVKKQVQYYIARARYNNHAANENKPYGNDNLNIVFEGNSGTGKTVVAKLLAEILYENGITDSPNMHHSSAKEFLRAEVGMGTEHLTQAIKESNGGVLFIDDAYELGSTDKSHNADLDALKENILSELVRQIGEDQNQVVLVLAGYTDEMEKFLAFSNPGLASKFGRKVYFPDYTVNQLYDIFLRKAKNDHCVIYDPAVLTMFKKELKKFVPYAIKNHNIGNATTMGNLLDLIEDCRNLRNNDNMEELDWQAMNVITVDDVHNGFVQAYKTSMTYHSDPHKNVYPDILVQDHRRHLVSSVNSASASQKAKNLAKVQTSSNNVSPSASADKSQSTSSSKSDN